MAGFFPHTGGSFANFTALAMPTFATTSILDSIFADVGAGINGWTVFDDQRADTTFQYNVFVGGVIGGVTISLTNASTTMTGGTGTKFLREFITGTSQISSNGTNFYTVNTVSTDTGAVLGTTFGQSSSAYHNVLTKASGYLVLKCTGTIRDFYVQIIRPTSYGNALLVQVYDTWNASTHTGTNPGPMETLRAYDIQKLSTTKIRYILWLLPNTFGLFAEADPAETGTLWGDFFYAGVLTPFRNTDTTCLMQACSNQSYSGIAPTNSTPTTNNPNPPTGGAPVYKNLAGQLWNPTGVTTATYYSVWPRGMPYWYDINRNITDENGKLQFCDLDLYFASQTNTAGLSTEGKRGDIRYLKYPVGFPSGYHLSTFGPADDLNTYMLIRCSLGGPAGSGSQSVTDFGVTSGTCCNGFSFAYRIGTIGEITTASVNQYVFPRYFLMPTNL